MAVVVHQEQRQAAEVTLIAHSDKLDKMAMMRRTTIRRSTKMMREKMMKMKNTIVNIIEDDYILSF